MRTIIISLTIMFSGTTVAAQRDTSLFKRISADTGGMKMNMDAVYNRPMLQAGKLPVTLGGYIEGNASYFSENGVSEGVSFQLPRLTLFVASTIKSRIKFLTELEFEEGGKEVNIEFASVDIELHPLLNLRGGIIMNPIGAFNQNHDGPKWEFVDRPIAATTIIPATWSTAGFGIYGKLARQKWVWAYEAYITNGFDDKIINNGPNRTWMPASKDNTERFNESFNGSPLITLKTAMRHRKWGEIGLSWMGGVYNKFQEDGIVLDKKRRVDFLAVDINTKLPHSNTILTGEWVRAFIDIAETYSQQFGNRQQGGFLDIIQPVVRRSIPGWSTASINLALRAEYADYNVGKFTQTKGNIYDQIVAIAPGISLRPSGQTVFRANYRYEWQRDLLGNPATGKAGFQIGLSTYF